MAIEYLRRSSGLPANCTSKNKANPVFVDSTDDSLNFGTGTSGSSTKKAVDTTSSQVVAGKQLQGIAPLSLTGDTTLTVAAHDGVDLVFNKAAGGTITLPAALGTGAKFRIFIGTTLTSGSFKVQVANATDFMRGQAWTIGSANAGFLTANTGTVSTESDTVTFNRTTTGLGTIGDYLEFEDIAATVWAVELDYASSGTAATPFSAAV